MGLIVRKSELAEELGCSRPRVSALIKDGLPVELDGRVNLEHACQWVLRNISSDESRIRWNADMLLGFLQRARERGEPDRDFGLSDEERASA
jgi:hypothetical protein